MVEGQDEATVPSDGALIAAVRGGDAEAYGVLFSRHHAAALRLARQLAGPADADDLVSDAFTKVYNVLRRGDGPEIAFRAYLLTAVRRLHVDKIRAARMVTPTDEIEQHGEALPFVDPAVTGFESTAAANAFRSLPERWQLVLWHLEVEAQKPAEVASLLGMSPNGVSALGYRAREGLRQAYLQMHLNDCSDDECRWATERLGARVRNGLSRRDQRKVDEHVDGCRRCSSLLLELADVNAGLAGILAPVVLGVSAAGYVSAQGSGVGVSTNGAWSVLNASRHAINAHGLLTGAGAAASVIAVATGATLVVQHLGGGQAVADTQHLRSHVIGSTAGSSSQQRSAAAGRLATTHSAPRALRRSKAVVVNRKPPFRSRGGSIVTRTLPPVPPRPTPPGSTPPPTPPTRTRHSTPPTSPPDQIDVSMSRSSAQGRARTGQMEAHLRVTLGPAAQETVTLTFSLPTMSRLTIGAGGWQCDPWPPLPDVTEYSCTITSANPPTLNVQLRTVDHASPWIQAHATVAGVVDPNPDNDWFDWQL